MPPCPPLLVDVPGSESITRKSLVNRSQEAPGISDAGVLTQCNHECWSKHRYNTLECSKIIWNVIFNQISQLFKNWFPIKSKSPKLRLVWNQNPIICFLIKNSVFQLCKTSIQHISPKKEKNWVSEPQNQFFSWQNVLLILHWNV
jgi:hypothetical protein